MSQVVILVSTFNGEPFIREQISSLYEQSHRDIRIIVRDDGSTDETPEILKDYEIEVLPNSQNLGAQASFFSLLQYAVKKTEADYFMFCDQDDVWQRDKVEVTLARLQELEASHGKIPLLVHTDLVVVDQQLNTIAPSMWEYEYILPQKNSFSRLLVQNTVTGCTTMINRSLAQKCPTEPTHAIMHDWWFALVASHFGYIDFISTPTILYRQHLSNTIGAQPFKVKPIRHFLGLLRSIFSMNNNCLNSLTANIRQAQNFLYMYESELNYATRETLLNFITLAQKSHFKRKLSLLKYGLLRQGATRNFSLIINI